MLDNCIACVALRRDGDWAATQRSILGIEETKRGIAAAKQLESQCTDGALSSGLLRCERHKIPPPTKRVRARGRRSDGYLVTVRRHWPATPNDLQRA